MVGTLRFAQPAKLQGRVKEISARLPRRLGMDRQRMHRAFEFRRERRVNHAVALDPALSAEGFRYDIESEMGFAARPVPGMALVVMGFILDA